MIEGNENESEEFLDSEVDSNNEIFSVSHLCF
jgi:hypothetical protein